MSYQLGFIIRGSVQNPRALVDRGLAESGFASCSALARVEQEAYLSLWAYPLAMKEKLEQTPGSVKGYSAEVWSDRLTFDIDCAGDVQASLEAARRLAGFVEFRFCDEPGRCLIYYSGSKGFHVELPLSHQPAPSLHFHEVAKTLAKRIADEVGVTIDGKIYDRVRPYRAPNSRHPKTGLHKRLLTFDELTGLKLAAIQKLAEQPIEFELPVFASLPCDQELAQWWNEAEQTILVQGEQRSQYSDAEPKINYRIEQVLEAQTIPKGERETTLFQAAANLAEFASVEQLIEAILTPIGRNSGLNQHETAKAIRDGISHTRAKGKRKS